MTRASFLKSHKPAATQIATADNPDRPDVRSSGKSLNAQIIERLAKGELTQLKPKSAKKRPKQ